MANEVRPVLWTEDTCARLVLFFSAVACNILYKNWKHTKENVFILFYWTLYWKNKNIDCQWPISEIRDFNIRQQTCESKNWNQMTQFRAINIQFFHYSISIKFKTLLITYLSFLSAPISYKCPPLLCNNSRRSECNAFYICLVIIMVTLQPTLPVLPKFSYVP